MILSVHLVAGAALSSFIPSPILLAPASVALHLACDVIPHWEYDFMNTSKKRAALKIVADIAVGIFIITFIAHSDPSRLILALWGGFFGILPDGITVLYLLSKKKIFRLFTRFHVFCHTAFIKENEHPPVWIGALTQTAVITFSVFLLLHY